MRGGHQVSRNKKMSFHLLQWEMISIKTDNAAETVSHYSYILLKYTQSIITVTTSPLYGANRSFGLSLSYTSLTAKLPPTKLKAAEEHRNGVISAHRITGSVSNNIMDLAN